ncbi:hypothetical protein OsJ_35602 [Oryza sativa Japonica Group]|uniref:Uncharacterized protein n=1 Tax=Oryza sativa subsp. japonica TaxID=39947 RepID=A3CFZ5_ORYSJ|nr:hypothetical protein OsJ_35602 [Oryza sativa Japonica Group]
MASGGGTTPATEERTTCRRRHHRGSISTSTAAATLLRSVAAAVLLVLFTGSLVFYALCAAAAPPGASPGGVVTSWKAGSSAWLLLCLVVDVVVVSGLVVERFGVGKEASSMVEEDQLGGDVQGGDNHVLPFDLNIDAPGPQVLPFDLNIDAPGHQGEMNPDNGDAMDQVLQLYGGHIHNAFPFDINSDAFEEHLQMQADMQEYGLYAGDVDIVFEHEELDDSDQEDEQPYKNLTNIQRQQIYI